MILLTQIKRILLKSKLLFQQISRLNYYKITQDTFQDTFKTCK